MAMNAWNCFVYIMLGVIFLASANSVDSLADIGVDQESCCSSSDLEDQCGFVCYPILKPLLQYLEKCQEMDLQIKELEDMFREQSVEIIKYKSKTEVLSKHLENNFCDTKVMELGDAIDVRIDVQEEIKKLKLELASKESDIIDMNSKLFKKYELLEQKNKSLKETETAWVITIRRGMYHGIWLDHRSERT
ncbi:fibroleukin-like [Drosophila madeirensis]|uniref:Fibroleukin-like n=1 Tax=Drosophila madeirensis TaxID=30013 RepID=A0AAU9FBV1_DROMD